MKYFIYQIKYRGDEFYIFSRFNNNKYEIPVGNRTRFQDIAKLYNELILTKDIYFNSFHLYNLIIRDKGISTKIMEFETLDEFRELPQTNPEWFI